MNDSIKMLFKDNPEMEIAIKEFCANNPEYLQIKQEFYETAREIAGLVGYNLYSRFEEQFGAYLARANGTYYLFGLGLRQEVITALGI